VLIFSTIICFNNKSPIVTNYERYHFFVLLKCIQVEAFSTGLTKASHKTGSFIKNVAIYCNPFVRPHSACMLQIVDQRCPMDSMHNSFIKYKRTLTYKIRNVYKWHLDISTPKFIKHRQYFGKYKEFQTGVIKCFTFCFGKRKCYVSSR
jgi:hypothetical protein